MMATSMTQANQPESSSTSSGTASAAAAAKHKSGSMKRQNTMNITKELDEYVAYMLGPSVKISLKMMLKLELKGGDKLENRLLTFSTFRMYMIAPKGSSSKLEASYNYVDISSIESRQPDKLTFGFQCDSRHYSFQSCDPNQEEVNVIIRHVVTALKSLFPNVALECFIRRLAIEPGARMDKILQFIHMIDQKARFRVLDYPCGGFSTQYACFCDYYGVPYREEVAWDIDTIYAAHGNTELSILDFEHLDLKDLLPIIAALAYNGWFTKFRVSNFKIAISGNSVSDQLCEQIINVVRRSTTLEEIYLENTGIRADFVNKLFAAMLMNNQTSIQVIDLSKNSIEDKGVKNLTSFVAKSFHMANSSVNNNNSNEDLSSSISLNFSSNSHQNQTTITSSAKLMYKGLVHLNLSHCGITSKGISELSESLYLNKSMFSTLTYLNLSDNCFKDDISKLYNFLAQPNNVAHLDLSGTDCNIESVFGALLHGCTNNLIHLNLSRNQFSTKRSSHKDLVVPVAIKKFFSTAIFLRTINLSHNRLPTEALKAILLGLACNESAADIRINLSSNDFKANGAAVLELCLSDIRCVSGLDLSDNGLDMDLISVVNAISKNKAIKYLSIGRNFNNVKTKHLPKVLDAFVGLLQDADCSIESLSLIDSKLRGETSIILNALGSNQSLINMDISGNLMGLAGAKTLAKALQVNNRLETIYLDRNAIPTSGFVDIAYSLERNFTLKYLPIPVQDAQAAMIKLPERTEAAVTKIQELIRRNNLPQTAMMRNLRLHTSAANSHFLIDNELFSKIEKIALQLQTLLRDKSSSLSNDRMPSLDSIDMHSCASTASHLNDATIVPDDYSDEFVRIENLLREVQNLRSLFNKVQAAYSQTQSINGCSSLLHHHHHENYGRRFSANIALSRPIEASINEFSKEMKHKFEAQVTQVSELIIQSVKEQFPHFFFQSQRLELELRELYKSLISSNSAAGNNSTSLIPPVEYFQLCLTETAGATWSIKLEQILNTVASQLCNRILLETNRCLLNAREILSNSDSKSMASNHFHSNGTGNSMRSITPEIILRNHNWIESSSSQDSTDLLNYSKSDCKGLEPGDNNAMWLAWLNLATPKLQNPKRQNIYIRKLRPQSVLDGSIVPNEEFPDLLKNDPKDLQSPMLDGPASVGTEVSSGGNHVHLTKMRPRNRKTRAPTRVTIVDGNKKDQTPLKLDEGLDGFFPTANLLTTSPSSTSIESKEIEQLVLAQNKPQPQPRKILRKFGFKSPSEQVSNNSEHPLRMQSLDKPGGEDRSISPTIIMPKREHVSICSDADQIRPHSPMPSGDAQHHELLAEIKAKQEKRSYNSTPVSNEQLTFASALEKAANQEEGHSKDDGGGISVAKRATKFGDLHKSPSKHSVSSPTEDAVPASEPPTAKEKDAHNNNNNGIKTPRQRPKSMVGMLGAKFELSLNSNK